jgi:hypothetical protein
MSAPGSASRGEHAPKQETLALLFGEDAAVAPKFQTTVVRGVLHKGSITVIYGKPKSGKSFLGTDLALAVADRQRERWMEHRIMQHGPVLYVACEGHGGYWKRLRATGQLVPDQFVLATGRPKLILNPDANGRTWVPHPDDIDKACDRVFAEFGCLPILIVIDTVFRSFGGANVNDSAHMNTYVEAAQKIADKEIAIVLVHHSTKAGSTPAGSISLIGAADTLISVEKKEGCHVWSVEEAKDDAETPPREFVLEVVDGIADAFGEYVSSCKVVDRGPHKQETQEKRPGKKEQENKPKGPKPRTPNAEAVWSALMGLFAKPGVPQEREMFPGAPPVRSVTRDQLRDQLRTAGLIQGTATGAMSTTERGWLRNQLVALANRGEIIMRDDFIAWAPQPEKPAS